MRVSISTFYSDFNYGALLQATALCRFLCDELNCDARLLNHSAPIERQIFRSWRNPRGLARNLLIMPYVASMRRRAKKTRAFMLAHQRWTEPLRPGNPLPPSDVFIAGSDQVWNVEKGINPLFFLSGVDPTVSRLVAYAASFGTEHIPPDCRDDVAELLRRFHFISVRESSGADIVESLLGKRPPVVCDPVFLRSADDWRAMEERSPQRARFKNGYVLVYAIRKDEILERCTAFVKRQTGLPVVQLLPGFNLWALRCADRRWHDAGPGEFLDLVDHAAFVCTNSFHCGAFSLIFGKPFLMAPSTLGRSTRLTNLLQLFGESDRFFDKMPSSDSGFAFDRLLHPDANRWNVQIDEIRSEGGSYLRRSLL